ncbi:MAG TPA: hypothetical protein VFP68_04445, partial [Burkholderiaceae bacterium]|nr:hypothetical protein [Burkholderiaceae bacterium]
MFGSGVLDTAIGLLFVFLLVSLLVTIANELISSAMLSRAKWLQYGVARLLGSEWAQRLYAHPLISSTTSSPPEKVDNKLPWRGGGPSYIPSRSFANVLVDLVRSGDTTLQAIRLSLQNALDTARDKQLPLEDLTPALMDAATPYSADAKALSTDIAKLLGDIVDRDKVSRQWLSQL